MPQEASEPSTVTIDTGLVAQVSSELIESKEDPNATANQEQEDPDCIRVKKDPCPSQRSAFAEKSKEK